MLQPGGGGAGERKRAFLLGYSPDSGLLDSAPKSKMVRFLYKFHLWKGNAVYRYDLVDGVCHYFDAVALTGGGNTIADWLKEAEMNGYEVEHPRGNDDINKDNVDDWVEFGKRATERLGREVG